MEFFFTTPNSTNSPSADIKFRLCPNKMSEMSANGTVSGSEIKMMNGFSQDSNCAAKIRYMKTNESPNASKKPLASSDDDLDRPVGTRRYAGPVCCFSKAAFTALTTSLSPKPGATLAMNVT